MQIAQKYARSLYLSRIVSVVLLLFLLPGHHLILAESVSHQVETMTMAELDRILTGSQGMHVLFFTASWCGHCKAMLPTLNRLYRRFHENGLRFIAVSIDVSKDEMQRGMDDQPAAFPVIWAGDAAVDRFKLIGIPMIFLIKKGRPVEKIPGKCSYAFLEAKIQDYIK